MRNANQQEHLVFYLNSTRCTLDIDLVSRQGVSWQANTMCIGLFLFRLVVDFKPLALYCADACLLFLEIKINMGINFAQNLVGKYVTNNYYKHYGYVVGL